MFLAPCVEVLGVGQAVQLQARLLRLVLLLQLLPLWLQQLRQQLQLLRPVPPLLLLAVEPQQLRWQLGHRLWATWRIYNKFYRGSKYQILPWESTLGPKVGNPKNHQVILLSLNVLWQIERKLIFWCKKVDLSEGLSTDVLQPILGNAEFMRQLRDFLPPVEQPSSDTVQMVRDTVQSPQFAQVSEFVTGCPSFMFIFSIFLGPKCIQCGIAIRPVRTVNTTVRIGLRSRWSRSKRRYGGFHQRPSEPGQR